MNLIHTDLKTKIISKQELVPHIFLLKLKAPLLTQSAIPGQFIHIQCSENNHPLLRRPFSLHRIDKEKGEVYILFRVVGEGTKILSQRKEGEYLDILGPLGNGFNLNLDSRFIMLVGGGMGVAPLLALAEEGVKMGKKVKVLISALTKNLIIREEAFKKCGAEVEAITEDGSYSRRGLITELLRENLNKKNFIPDQLFACGPKVMLREIVKICADFHLENQISLEERMGCGIGACLGCVCKIKVVENKDGQNFQNNYVYKRICSDGPIFKGEEVVWDD
ncbi:MAG: dihydroorotate dehydrogenase electron transfer subunit [Candidatus Caldatribacteriota bacterium]